MNLKTHTSQKLHRNRCLGNDSARRAAWPTSARPARRKGSHRSSTIVLGLTGRRRQSRMGGIGRCVVLVFLLLSLLASTDAGLFKRRGGRAARKGSSGGARHEGKKQVKENVAWLLEDKADGGWNPVSDDGHVKVWKREVPGSAFVAIKSSATLMATPQALFEVLTPGDIEIVRQYNPLVEDGRDVEVLDRDNKISWSATMAIWPTRGRDFVTHIRRAQLDDGSVAIVNSATNHVETPVTSKYVRGEILHGVFLIKAAKNRAHSEFTMVHHFNPGGNIPAWLVNWLAEGKPSTFVRRLEEVAQKWDAEAKRVKNMPCKGRGFGDRPCAFLLPKRDDNEGEEVPPAPGSLRRSQNVGSWVKSAVKMLAAALATAVLGCFGWIVLVRQKQGFGGVVEAFVSAHPASPDSKKLSTNGDPAAQSGDSAVPNGDSEGNGARGSAVENEGYGGGRSLPACDVDRGDSADSSAGETDISSPTLSLDHDERVVSVPEGN